MQQKAKVEKIIDADKALISVRRKSACSSDCDNCRGCAHPEETIDVTAHNLVGASEGDTVLVESGTGYVLTLAMLLYLMPIALMIGAYFLPFAGESVKILSSLVGLLCGIAICIVVSRRMKKNSKMTFSITRVLDENN